MKAWAVVGGVAVVVAAGAVSYAVSPPPASDAAVAEPETVQQVPVSTPEPIRDLSRAAALPALRDTRAAPASGDGGDSAPAAPSGTGGSSGGDSRGTGTGTSGTGKRAGEGPDPEPAPQHHDGD